MYTDDDHCDGIDKDGDSGSMEHDTEVVVAIEFRGDDFVFQQVRRVIGSVVVAEYMNRIQKTIIGRHSSRRNNVVAISFEG
jgi:tRNA U38,U39,U40 pseudouridine synthase TruA